MKISRRQNRKCGGGGKNMNNKYEFFIAGRVRNKENILKIGEYEATDTLYNIFEEIFNNEAELEEFLEKYRGV